MTRSRTALWAAFGAVHAVLTWLGVVVVPAQAFWDLDLYRWWAYLSLVEGQVVGVDQTWVYPVGALAPVLLPGLVSTLSPPAYALAWCAMVAVLDGAALAVLLRLPRGVRAGWWWTAGLALLGPVAIGRLDGVLTPLTITALAAAALGTGRHRTRAAAVLLTLGAWVKVAPGALLLPLAAAARRPWHDVVLPAAVVTAGVVGATVAAGGGGHLLGFASTQGGRGLQVEAVGATPWTLLAAAGDRAAVVLDEALITYQVVGPGTTVAAAALDAALVAGVVTVAGWVLVLRRRGTAQAALLPASLTLATLLVVANKVGSPQYLTWLVPPVVVALASAIPARPAGAGGHRERGWVRGAAVLTLVASALTQVVFPWGYPALLAGQAWVAVVLAARNLTLVAVLAVAVAWTVDSGRAPAGRPAGPSAPELAQ